jgi:hypothetical protein
MQEKKPIFIHSIVNVRAKFNSTMYYVIRSKNEVLCAEAGCLAVEPSEADKAAKAHRTIFVPNNVYYFFFKPS